MNWLYLALNLGALGLPLLLSFDKKVHFYKRWSKLIPAILIPLVVFIIWDVLFTAHGHWGFNDSYITGLKIFGLPIEEWAFFITIPYACVFIYDCLKYYGLFKMGQKTGKALAMILCAVLLVLAAFNIGKFYTSITFSGLSILILFLLIERSDFQFGHFFMAYLVILIPFFLVNGILTGSGIENEVVWYNDNMNLGIRLGTIPVEDVFYGMLLILMNVTIYEYLQAKSTSGESD